MVSQDSNGNNSKPEVNQDEAKEAPLTNKETDKLASKINKLKQDDLAKLIEIIQRMEGIEAPDEEIEIDFENYKASTLRELDAFVNEKVSDEEIKVAEPAPKNKPKKKRGRLSKKKSTERHEPKVETEYKIGDKVLCLDPKDRLYREAKVVDVFERDDGIVYKIHYMGWNAKYDEIIEEGKVQERFKVCTAKNLNAAKSELQARLQTSRRTGTPKKRSNIDAGTSESAKKPSTMKMSKKRPSLA